MDRVGLPHYRFLFVSLLILSTLTLASSYATAGGTQASELSEQYHTAPGNQRRVAPPAENITVITTQDAPNDRDNGAILALRENGTVLYYNNSHDVYYDVDPVPGTRATVEYVATKRLRSYCSPSVDCNLNLIERVNLSTGEVTRVYDRYVDQRRHNWHDADRVSESKRLVADIANDRVYVVNLTRDRITWQWSAQSAYPITGGGYFPSDWTHLNDVEVLENGSIMVSLRNQDQVVFVDQQTGLKTNKTLGADGETDTLHEQHNPDYIASDSGNDAVLVADSENNRVVEYSRVSEGWEQSWQWEDRRLQWPRDADRLPDGHTLITDSNGDRVLEINKTGAVIWSYGIQRPYEAERLETGDESTHGVSAAEGGLRSREGEAVSESDQSSPSVVKELSYVLLGTVRGIVPAFIFNSILFVLPPWMTATDLPILAVLTLSLVAWVAVELKHSGVSVSFSFPIKIER